MVTYTEPPKDLINRIESLESRQNIFEPQDYGLASWTYDPITPVTGSLLTNGTVYLSRIQIRKTVTITNVYWWVTTAGATPTAGQNAIGIYTATGTLLCSANVDASISTQGVKSTQVFGTTELIATDQWYWVGFLFNALTAPTLARATSLISAHLGLTDSERRFAANATAQTALPDPVNPVSNIGPGFAGPWAAVA